jgi:exonuclease SbcC
VDDAAAVLEAARTDRDEAAREAETARGLVAALAAEHARLASVSVPAGAAELDQRRAAAAGAVTAAGARLEEAEQADAAARTALGAAAPEAPLAQASRDLGDLRTVLPEVARAGQAAGQAAAARQAADEAQAGAEQRRRAAAADVEETRRAHVVAGLRPHLVAGELCPVCEQTVTALPAPVAAREVDAAETRLAQADQAVRAAQAAARDAVAAAGTADADLAAGLRRQTALAGGLAALLSGPLAGYRLAAGQAAVAAIAAERDSTDLLASAAAEVAGLAASRRAAEQAAERAAAAAQRARAAHRAAQAQAAATDAELTTAQAALRSARDPLVELGAPPVDGTGLAAGWAALARWAGVQASARSAALDQARAAEAAAAGRRDKLAAEFGAAEQALARLRAAAKDASRADAGARASLSQVTARVAELTAELAGAPGEEKIAEGLALLAELEANAVAARDAVRAARGQRAAREAELAALEETERTARGQLSAARDRVVALGAPAVGDRGLLDGWTHLVTWASGAVKAREQQAETAAREADAARARTDELTGRLSADLAGAGIDLGPAAVAAGAGSAVTGALAAAGAATRRIAERRAAAAGLAARQRTAQEEQQVAHLLGNLLQARQFPQWLVSEALDELVAAASTTLEALSGGQFNLTHDKGDLFVIDRTDADARRSVRTLSGGETFQASLALALALSSQISALAAAGAARLDAIFLDEGFGTLDPETLEVVAATLEALAEGDRMVGVVTHVAALAERVPVRFRVARNAVTSTVTREGLPTGTDEG